MNVYSWNVLRLNRNLREINEFIENLDFDILCLQEVTNEMLACFKCMPFEIAYAQERIIHTHALFSRIPPRPDYSVILSRHPILSSGTISFPEITHSLNSKLFVFLMSVIGIWGISSRPAAVFADIQVQDRKIRVFSTHLALWNPKTRAEEFEKLSEYFLKDMPILVCGDFNILEWGPIKILNWVLGSSIREALPSYPERALFEERFKKAGLRNPLLGTITHAFSHSQLDHILVSKDFTVKRVWVEKDAHGSDHQPIGAEIDSV